MNTKQSWWCGICGVDELLYYRGTILVMPGVFMRFIWGPFLAVGLVSTAMATEIEVAAGVEYFQWEEFSDGGRKYLDETGPRTFIEVGGINQLDTHWLVDFGLRLYSGTVDYDGETMGGRPVQTQTDYNGARAELGYTRRVTDGTTPESGLWLVRFGLGIDQWRRGLQDTALSDGTPVSGYVERYTSSYAKLGAIYRREGSFGAGVGAKAPLYTAEKVELGGSTLTLNPEGQLSLFADLEIPVSVHWLVTLRYDSYRFAKSDQEDGYVQPESTQDSAGIALHYRF
jgi:hypothetical protein